MSSTDPDAGGWKPDAGAFDALTTGVVVVDATVGVVHLNRAAADVLTDGASALGRPADEVIFDDSARGMVAEVLEHVRGGATWSGSLPVRWGGQVVQADTS